MVCGSLMWRAASTSRESVKRKSSRCQVQTQRVLSDPRPPDPYIPTADDDDAAPAQGLQGCLLLALQLHANSLYSHIHAPPKYLRPSDPTLLLPDRIRHPSNATLPDLLDLQKNPLAQHDRHCSDRVVGLFHPLLPEPRPISQIAPLDRPLRVSIIQSTSQLAPWFPHRHI